MINHNIKGLFYSVFNKGTALLWLISILLLFFSFFDFSVKSIDEEVANIQNVIHKRQQTMDMFANKAFETSDSLFLNIPDVPDDIVIYKYCNDTLQSWINEFPISNDDISSFFFAYSINTLKSRNINNPPLAYIHAEEQYVSLGSSWYVLNLYLRGNEKVLVALLIQTDYSSNNKILKNKLNPNITKSDNISIIAVPDGTSNYVFGAKGCVLFSVRKDISFAQNDSVIILRWLAIFLIVLALLLDLRNKRTLSQLLITIFSLFGLWIISLYFSSNTQGDIQLFSPNLYADFNLFTSLADLLLNNTFIILIVTALFIVRRDLILFCKKLVGWRSFLFSAVLLLLPLLLIAYIHITLRSLIFNSGIVLELFKIEEISIFTVAIYISYAFLFLSLVFSLELCSPLLSRGENTFSFLKTKSLIVAVALFSLYTLITVGVYGFKKEFNTNKVLTTKLSVERDLNAELYLRSIERQLAKDNLIVVWTGIGINVSTIANRLAEQYFSPLLQRYEMEVSVCKNNTYLLTDQRDSVNCFAFYDVDLQYYGTPLSNDSHFYFIDKSSGRISYIGILNYSYPEIWGDIRLYIKLQSKFLKENIGYNELLSEASSLDNVRISFKDSYARYMKGRLVSYKGKYDYSTTLEHKYKEGYDVYEESGYLHFVNSMDGGNVVMISRESRSVFPYVVTFSYIMLFYSLIIMGALWIRHTSFLFKLPRKSFRWRITSLILGSLVFALLAMGIGSIWFAVSYINASNRVHMQEKMQTVQSTFSDFSEVATSCIDPIFDNTLLTDAMARLMSNIQVDINIYSPQGKILKTTKLEIFDRYLLGGRMNSDAYKEIVYNKKRQFINKEKIADLTYYSLYAPLFNRNGTLIAIVNIPYFSKEVDMQSDVTSIVATIINIYLLLLIAAVFGGIGLSNSLSRPLEEISSKMKLLNISERPEIINYNHEDELGDLVSAYNKMVIDLEESTQRLAQGEREQAWREMARQIAHEIKNPLTPMRLSLQHLVRMKKNNVAGWEEKFEELAHSLLEQIDILSDTAGEFSSFSRFYSEEIVAMELNSLIREQLVLFNTRDNVMVRFESEVDKAVINARRDQLTRVLVNLISNAIQAVESNRLGSVLIKLTMSGSYYNVAIHDDGTGVPEELTGRLFKPNFTTKTGGTGLGLAICRSIIEQSQGSIHYEKSDLLGGANFTFLLPVAASSSSSSSEITSV